MGLGLHGIHERCERIEPRGSDPTSRRSRRTVAGRLFLRQPSLVLREDFCGEGCIYVESCIRVQLVKNGQWVLAVMLQKHPEHSEFVHPLVGRWSPFPRSRRIGFPSALLPRLLSLHGFVLPLFRAVAIRSLAVVRLTVLRPTLLLVTIVLPFRRAPLIDRSIDGRDRIGSLN